MKRLATLLALGAVALFTTAQTGPVFNQPSRFNAGYFSSLTIGSTGSLALLQTDAANILAQRNSTNPQAYRAYNTFTDASNYERGFMRWNTNVFQVGTESAGTGSSRKLQFVAAGAGVWEIATNGGLLASTDNSWDIGAAGATRPRNLYVASAIYLTAPNTQTGSTYTILATDNFVIANASGTLTLTLPAAGASNVGRTIRVKTIAAQTVVSATSNVVPLAGGSASTPILLGTAGKWADLTSDGSNWVIMAGN